MSIDENKALARRGFEALMSGSGQPLDDVLAPDCVLHQCGFLEPICGIDAIKSLPGGGRVSERETHVERMVAEGDIVAIHWSTTGRYRDPGSSPPVDQEVSFMTMSFLRIDGGKVREIWNIQDRSTLQSQLERAAGEGQ